MALVSIGERVEILLMPGAGASVAGWGGLVVAVDDHGIRFEPEWGTYAISGEAVEPEHLGDDCVLTWKAISGLRVKS